MGITSEQATKVGAKMRWACRGQIDQEEHELQELMRERLIGRLLCNKPQEIIIKIEQNKPARPWSIGHRYKHNIPADEPNKLTLAESWKAMKEASLAYAQEMKRMKQELK